LHDDLIESLCGRTREIILHFIVQYTIQSPRSGRPVLLPSRSTKKEKKKKRKKVMMRLRALLREKGTDVYQHEGSAPSEERVKMNVIDFRSGGQVKKQGRERQETEHHGRHEV